jgi:PAS domain S-box-containing protein
MTDEMQRVTYINRKAAHLFGVTLEGAKNQHIMEVIHDQEILGSVLDVLKRLMESEEKSVSAPVTLPREGERVKTELMASGIKNKDGQLEYAAIVIR